MVSRRMKLEKEGRTPVSCRSGLCAWWLRSSALQIAWVLVLVIMMLVVIADLLRTWMLAMLVVLAATRLIEAPKMNAAFKLR